MPEYKGLDVVRRVRPLNEEQLNEIIDEKRQEGASLIPVEGRKSKDGDTVIVDLEGTFEANPNPNRSKPMIWKSRLAMQISNRLLPKICRFGRRRRERIYDGISGGFFRAGLAGKTINYKAKIKSVGNIELARIKRRMGAESG